jgi:regulator of protease activity HflC (stomatin/prohibitin superfamily)
LWSFSAAVLAALHSGFASRHILGRRTRGPGLYWIIPLIEGQQTVDLPINTAAVEQQETITKDNVPIKVNAVVWYRIVDPKLAVIEVKNFDLAVIQVALTTLRTGIGRHSLDDVLKEQETVASIIQGLAMHVLLPQA